MSFTEQLSEELCEIEFEYISEEASYTSIKSEIDHILDELLNIWAAHECHKLEIKKIEYLFEHFTDPPMLLDYNLVTLQKICWENFDFLQLSSEWNFRITEIAGSLANDGFAYCQKNYFTPFQSLAFVKIFHATFTHFIDSHRNSLNDIITFFKEIVFLHTVQDPPKSLEIFTIEDCKIIYEYFRRYFIENLILLRAVTAENCVIKIRGKFEIPKIEEIKTVLKKK